MAGNTQNHALIERPCKMENWVILFVRTGSEEKLVHMLKDILCPNEYLPFLPVKEVHRRIKGANCIKRNLLFPGYVFIKTGINANQIAKKLRTALKVDNIWPQDIIRILHYGDDENDVAVRKSEKLFWERLFDDEFCITGSVGVIEGDNVKVMSGPLVGKEGCIKKINRHKREAIVEMEVMGGVREVRVMLEVVEKRG